MKRHLHWLVLSVFIIGLIAGACLERAAEPATAKPATPALTATPIEKPQAPAPGLNPRNIILIGWDGAQRNHLKECIERRELPNLVKLTSEGALVAIDITRTTDTKAGWTQILTGYEPEVTGVFSNGRYQPIPKGLTVFERLEEFFGKDSIATVAIIGKKGHVDADGPGWERVLAGQTVQPGERTVVRNGVTFRETPGKPYFNTKDNMDLFLNGLDKDEVVGDKALEMLDKYKDQRFFFFVHFAQIDHKGHQFGENAKETNDAYLSADTQTGRIIDKLRELGLYDRTLIYITADHGFDEGTKNHADAPYVFLATNDSKVIRRGLRVDITPTILERFGVDLGKLNPLLDGHPLTKPYEPPKW
jgi:hypothetical protein